MFDSQSMFALCSMDSRRIIQDSIADMDHDPAAEAEVIDAFTGAGLL